MRRSAWIRGLLLALPLVGLATWLTVGGISRSFGPAPETAAPVSGVGELASTPAAPALPDQTAAPQASALPPGLPSGPEDYGPETFFERVNGADEYLISKGCRRILVYVFDDPPAELELLVFETAEGASEVLARDAGPERHEGPGEEASLSDEAVFFRRGELYGRLYAMGEALPKPGALAALAQEIDRSVADWSEETAP
jgi:hypothetical protein